MTEKELRSAFERLVGTDSHGFRRSRRGTYTNPARARDWRMFKAGAQAVSMTAYVGHRRETEVLVQPVDMGAGAGRIMCLECEGTGDWTRFHPEPETGPHACVACKGTGAVLVSI